MRENNLTYGACVRLLTSAEVHKKKVKIFCSSLFYSQTFFPLEIAPYSQLLLPQPFFTKLLLLLSNPKYVRAAAVEIQSHTITQRNL